VADSASRFLDSWRDAVVLNEVYRFIYRIVRELEIITHDDAIRRIVRELER
jgi:hypothetical protein